MPESHLFDCAVCEAPNSADDMVQCSRCMMWLHYGCAGVDENVRRTRNWKCDSCIKERTVPRTTTAAVTTSATTEAVQVPVTSAVPVTTCPATSALEVPSFPPVPVTSFSAAASAVNQAVVNTVPEVPSTTIYAAEAERAFALKLKEARQRTPEEEMQLVHEEELARWRLSLGNAMRKVGCQIAEEAAGMPTVDRAVPQFSIGNIDEWMKRVENEMADWSIAGPNVSAKVTSSGLHAFNQRSSTPTTGTAATQSLGTHTSQQWVPGAASGGPALAPQTSAPFSSVPPTQPRNPYAPVHPGQDLQQYYQQGALPKRFGQLGTVPVCNVVPAMTQSLTTPGTAVTSVPGIFPGQYAVASSSGAPPGYPTATSSVSQPGYPSGTVPGTYPPAPPSVPQPGYLPGTYPLAPPSVSQPGYLPGMYPLAHPGMSQSGYLPGTYPPAPSSVSQPGYPPGSHLTAPQSVLQPGGQPRQYSYAPPNVQQPGYPLRSSPPASSSGLQPGGQPGQYPPAPPTVQQPGYPPGMCPPASSSGLQPGGQPGQYPPALAGVSLPGCLPGQQPAPPVHPYLVGPQSFAWAGGPTPQQLLARQVMQKDLPVFKGDPEDWPLFYSAFLRTTAACGYSDDDNLSRLQKAIQDRAYQEVKTRLLLPSCVPHVLYALYMRFGRPELIIHSLLRKVDELPPPKPEGLNGLADFGMAVQNLCDHVMASGQVDHLCNPKLLSDLTEKLPAQHRKT